MTRHQSKGYVYYQCRTFRDKARCSKHSIRLDVLEQAVLAALQKQIELAGPLSAVREDISFLPELAALPETLPEGDGYLVFE